MTWLIAPETCKWITPTDTVEQWIEYASHWGEVKVIKHTDTVTEIVHPYEDGTTSVWLETVA